MHTLIPIGTFEEKARRLLGQARFDEMLEFLARRPKAGRIIQGTGGLRKVRIARPGKGKPILLLLIYAKATQNNLTNEQKAQLKKQVDAIIDEFR